MIKFLSKVKIVSRLLALFSVLALLCTFVFYSTITSFSVPYKHQIQKDDNVSSFYNVSHKKAITKSRKSSVQMISIQPHNGVLSTFSGTYFESVGSYFIITVAHGIQGPCEFTKVIHDNELYDCKKYIVIDNDTDYAIIQVDEIEKRTPIKIPKDLPKNKQWIKSHSLLNKLVHTGYPNTIGPLTISGDVAGYASSEYIYMISYAWQGSSGAGVFDAAGRYIGHIVAVDVGQSEFGVQILSNLVLVVPAYKIDWTKVITESE